MMSVIKVLLNANLNIHIESVHKNTQVQDGNGSINCACVTRQSVGSHSGPVRRVLSCSHTSESATLPPFCLQGDSLPIPGVTIRAGNGSICVHVDPAAIRATSASSRDFHPHVPGRLAGSSSRFQDSP